MSYILVGLLFLWIGLSPLIWLYWYFKPERRSVASIKFVGVVAVGAFLAIAMLLAVGFESALFFIPSTILVKSGEDSLGEPEYETLRYSLASLLGIASAVGFFALMEKNLKLQREIRELNRRMMEPLEDNPK